MEKFFSNIYLMAGFVLFLAIMSYYIPEKNKFDKNLKTTIEAFIYGWLRVFSYYLAICCILYLLS